MNHFAFLRMGNAKWLSVSKFIIIEILQNLTNTYKLVPETIFTCKWYLHANIYMQMIEK